MKFAGEPDKVEFVWLFEKVGGVSSVVLKLNTLEPFQLLDDTFA